MAAPETAASRRKPGSALVLAAGALLVASLPWAAHAGGDGGGGGDGPLTNGGYGAGWTAGTLGKAGGVGGSDFQSFSVGGAGGTYSAGSPVGGNGGSGTAVGASGAGGGGGGTGAYNPGSVHANVFGGNGGSGGYSASTGGGGGGGGAGIVGIAGSMFTIDAGVVVMGGRGGDGGGQQASGGGGGAGVFMTANSTFTNLGTIQGGEGGAGRRVGGLGGIGGTGEGGALGAQANGPYAAGGAGVVLQGSNLHFINENGGSVVGGLSVDGVRANAITVKGLNNSVTLVGGSSLTGDVEAAPGGGNNRVAFKDTGSTASNIRNFDNISVGSGANWNVSGNLALGVNDGTTINLLGSVGVDSNLFLGGEVSGSSLTISGEGRMTLAGKNIYVGGTLVQGTSVTATNPESLGTGPITLVGGGALVHAYDGVQANPVSIGAGGQATLAVASNHDLSLTGPLTLNPDSTLDVNTATTGGTLRVDAKSVTIDNSASTVRVRVRNGTLTGSNLSAVTGVVDSVSVDAGATLDFGSASGTVRRLEGQGTLQLGANPANTVVLQGGEFQGAIEGKAALEINTNSGNVALGGASTYSGATRITLGALRATAAHALSPNSAIEIGESGKLSLNGYSQTVPGITNAGVLAMSGDVPGATLTVTGPFVGQGGVLSMATTLGDSTSVTDRLVLDGPAAVASGHTAIKLLNFGGLGAATTGSGIELIAARNGATTTAQTTKDAFMLSGGHVDAGAYEYRLYAGDVNGKGESWYLSTQARPAPSAEPDMVTKPGTAAPAPAPAPAASPAAAPAGATTYRAEAALMSAAPRQMQAMDVAMLGTMRSRAGDSDARPRMTASLTPVPGELNVPRTAWARVVYADLDVTQRGTVSPSTKGHVNGLQAGTDLFVGDLGLWRAGVFVGSLNGDADVTGYASGVMRMVGTSELSGRYIGAYATYAAPAGWYVDTTLQYGTQKYTSRSTAGLVSNGKGRSVTAGVEVGRSWAITGTRWVVEPQAQLSVRRARLDDMWLPGTLVRGGSSTDWTATLGGRIKGDFATAAGRLQPYARLNLVHGHGGDQSTGFAGPAGFTDLRASSNYTSTEVAGGATLSINRMVSVYGELGRMFSGGGDMKVKSSVQAVVGLRASW